MTGKMKSQAKQNRGMRKDGFRRIRLLAASHASVCSTITGNIIHGILSGVNKGFYSPEGFPPALFVLRQRLERVPLPMMTAFVRLLPRTKTVTCEPTAADAMLET